MSFVRELSVHSETSATTSLLRGGCEGAWDDHGLHSIRPLLSPRLILRDDVINIVVVTSKHHRRRQRGGAVDGRLAESFQVLFIQD